MDDRIRLAEAMNFYPTDTKGMAFDPFTSADDDYAVLSWMRGFELKGLTDEQWNEVVMTLPSADEYMVGDFARTALKVLERDDE